MEDTESEIRVSGEWKAQRERNGEVVCGGLGVTEIVGGEHGERNE